MIRVRESSSVNLIQGTPILVRSHFLRWKRLATGGFNGVVRIWDVSTGKEVYPSQDTVTRSFRSSTSVRAHLSQHALIPFVHGTFRWAAKLLSSTSEGCLINSPDGKMIAFENAGGSIGLMDRVTGKDLRKLVAGNKSVMKMCFSLSGEILASFDTNYTIRVWQTATGKKLWEQKNLREQKTLNALSFSPDGRYLASGGQDSDVRIGSCHGKMYVSGRYA